MLHGAARRPAPNDDENGIYLFVSEGFRAMRLGCVVCTNDISFHSFFFLISPIQLMCGRTTVLSRMRRFSVLSYSSRSWIRCERHASVVCVEYFRGVSILRKVVAFFQVRMHQVLMGSVIL